MHAPSPQLLRALRTSLTPQIPTTGVSRASLSLPVSQRCKTGFLPSSSSSSSYSSSSSHAPRPTRMIPRSHTAKPSSQDRLPVAKEENQGTDLNALNVLGNIPAPTTAVEATLDDGFHLDSGVKVRGGSGVLLVGGEAFVWRPWLARPGKSKAEMVNGKGQFELDEEVWGLLSVVWPRPDLLIIGMGASMMPLSPKTKNHLHSLGIRVDIVDTRNAASQFNMLATERGVSEVAAAMLPSGWKGGA